MAELHPQLVQDCLKLGQFPLCKLLLLQDANYPWFILVPDREAIYEIHHLTEQDQQQLLRESMILSHALEKAFAPDKLNIAALGNVVPQLHIHHIARYTTDPAWPAPVWGHQPRTPYPERALALVVDKIKSALADGCEFEV